MPAQLPNANFDCADLEGAQFRSVFAGELDALGLTPEQFDQSVNVDKALLPNYLVKAR